MARGILVFPPVPTALPSQWMASVPSWSISGCLLRDGATKLVRVVYWGAGDAQVQKTGRRKSNITVYYGVSWWERGLGSAK